MSYWSMIIFASSLVSSDSIEIIKYNINEALDSNTTATIYVPRSSVDAYKAAEGWSKFKDNIKGYDF